MSGPTANTGGIAGLDPLLERLPVAVFRTTSGGRIVAGNSALAELLGAGSMADLESVEVMSLYVDPEVRDHMVERVAAGVDVPPEEIEIRRLDGERIWARVSSLGVAAPDGGVFYEGVLENVTTRRRANASLARSNALLDTLAQIQSRFIVGVDPGETFDDLLQDLLRLTDSEYGFIAETLRHADGSAYLRSYAMTNIAWNVATRRMFEEKGPGGMEFHNLDTLFGAAVTGRTPVISNDPSTDPRSGSSPHGHPPLNSFLGVPILKHDDVLGMIALANRPGGYDDEIVAYLGPFVATVGSLIEAVRGAEARAEAEEGERVRERLFRSVVDAARDAVIVFDEAGTIEAFNPAAERLLGRRESEAVGASVRMFIPEEQFHRYEEALSHDSESRSILEMDLVHGTGHEFPAEVSFGAFRSHGRLIVTAVIRDVTERKATEGALRQARDAAERASKAKGVFLAGMSHELRTPLNAVIGLSTVLAREVYGTLTDKQREYLTHIESSGRHLLDILNDLLDLAKVEADKLEPTPTVVDAAGLIADCLSVVREGAVASRLSLLSSVDPELPALFADARLTKQALLNLLSNAVKFTPPGGSITVAAARAGPWVQISVTDDGPGIPADRLDDVFEMFERLDASLSTGHEGTGLGLALCRRFVEAQGGSVTVESQLGRGSMFTMVLPAATEQVEIDQAPVVVGREAMVPPGSSRRVLLAEDNEVNRMLIGDYLRSLGVDVVEARDGEEAVQLARDGFPDVILMDIQMPRVDGLAATREIKGAAETRHIPVIALTALAMKGDADRCLAAGCDAYISKPCDPADILRIINDLT